MPNSLILMSSISFGEYLNAGTTCMKFGQNETKPRPASLGQAGRPINLAIQSHIWPECSLVQIRANPMWFYTKCINQDPKAWAMTSWFTCSDQTQNQVPNRLEKENTSVDGHVGGTEGRGGTTPGRPA